MNASSARARVGLPRGVSLGSPRYRLAVAGFLLFAVALFGGASRIDENAQLPVRLAAVAMIAASLWPLDFSPLRANRRLALFALACVALPLVQLVPLPAMLWERLPGHSTYAEIARATATVGWRPLSLTPDLTVNALFALTVPAAVALATLYLDGKGRKTVAAAFVVIALVSAVLGLAQMAVPGEQLRLFQHTSEGAPVGLFANRNHQAVLLACAFPLCAAVVPPLSTLRPRLVMAGFLTSAVLVVSVVLLLTGSRMGLLLWVGGVLGAAWTLRARGLLRVSGRDTRIVVGAVSALALAGVLIAATFADGEILQRFRYQDIAADTRWAALPALLTTARTFFPAGSGLGSFAGVYPRFEPSALLSTIVLNQAHDEPVQLVIEGGALALALLLLFGWWWGRTAVQLAWHRRQAPQRGLPRAALVVTALLMTSSLVDYPLRTPLLASLFAFAGVEMALGVRRLKRAGNDPRPG